MFSCGQIGCKVKLGGKIMSKTINLFVSHKGEDESKIDAFKKLMERKGYDFRDSSIRESEPNKANNKEYIKKQYLKPAIDWAGTVVVLIGNNTHKSDWVNYPYMARPNAGFAQKGSTSYPTATGNFSGIQYGPDPNKPITRFFGSVSLEENALDVPTLAEGIKLSGTKMQYILFDACYMGNVETAYELKDVTNFMISSSSEVMGAGVPYKTVWSYLNSSTPNYSGFVNGVVNFYKNSSDPFCNMAAIDCRQMDNLAQVMKEINSKYTLSSSVPLDSIQPLDGFSPNLFYDMSVYVDSLVPSGSLKDKYTSQMKLTIKAAAHTEQAYTALKSYRGTTFKVKNYCGLSISDPSQHSVAIKGREKTAWWKATH